MHVPDGLVTAAVVHARNEGLVAIDVVPTDWSGLDALAFARRVMHSFRSDKLMKGGAACMVVASTRHVERLDRLPRVPMCHPLQSWLSESLKVATTNRVAHRMVPQIAPRSVGWSAVVAAGSRASSRAPVVWLFWQSILWLLYVIGLWLIEIPNPLGLCIGTGLAMWLFQPAIALGGGAWAPNDLAALA